MNKKPTQMTASAVEGGAHFLIWLLLKNTLCVCFKEQRLGTIMSVSNVDFLQMLTENIWTD